MPDALELVLSAGQGSGGNRGQCHTRTARNEAHIVRGAARGEPRINFNQFYAMGARIRPK